MKPRNSKKLRRLKFRVCAEKSNFRCWYCGIPPNKMRATRDHQLPKSRGGTREPENMVLACDRCNHEKADMDVETYRWFLQDKKPLGERVVFYSENLPDPWWITSDEPARTPKHTKLKVDCPPLPSKRETYDFRLSIHKIDVPYLKS